MKLTYFHNLLHQIIKCIMFLSYLNPIQSFHLCIHYFTFIFMFLCSQDITVQNIYTLCMFYLLQPGNISHICCLNCLFNWTNRNLYREDCTLYVSAFIDEALYALKLHSMQSYALYRLIFNE